MTGRRRAPLITRSRSTAANTRSFGIERLIDGVLEAAVVAFAAFTLLYYAARLFGLSVDLTTALWIPVAIVAIAVLVGRKSDTAGTDVEPSPRGAVAGTVVVAAALGALVGLVVLDVPTWWLFWVGAVAVLGASVFLVARARERSVLQPAVAGRGVATGIVVAAFVFGTLAAVVIRPDADDVLVVNRSVWIEERGGDFPERDVLFSDEVFALSRPDQVEPSFEAFIGAVARWLPWSATTVTYLSVGPIVAALSVLALYRLNRALLLRLPGVATFAGLVFLAFDGDVHTTFGNFSFGRAWQGKVALVCVILPLAAALGLEYGRRGRGRSVALLLAANVAAIGASTTGVLVAPIVSLVAIGAAAGRNARRVVGAALVAAVPLAAALFAAVRGRQPLEAATTLLLAAGEGLMAQAGRLPPLDGTAGLDAPDAWYTVMGSGVVAAVGAIALLTSWAAVLDRGARLFLAGAALVLLGFFLAPGVLHLLVDVVPTGSVLWRTMWIVPLPAAVGALVAGIAGLRRARPWLGPALAIGVMVLVMVGGTPVWSNANGARVGRPAWDVDAGALSAADQILDIASDGAVVAAPVDIGGAIAIQTTRVRAVNPRTSYMQGRHTVDAFAENERLLLTQAVELGGVPDQRIPGVRSALRNLDVSIACVRPALAESTGELALASEFFSLVAEDQQCRYWARG